MKLRKMWTQQEQTTMNKHWRMNQHIYMHIQMIDKIISFLDIFSIQVLSDLLRMCCIPPALFCTHSGHNCSSGDIPVFYMHIFDMLFELLALWNFCFPFCFDCVCSFSLLVVVVVVFVCYIEGFHSLFTMQQFIHRGT
jgi:hypothetical protein